MRRIAGIELEQLSHISQEANAWRSWTRDSAGESDLAIEDIAHTEEGVVNIA